MPRERHRDRVYDRDCQRNIVDVADVTRLLQPMDAFVSSGPNSRYLSARNPTRRRNRTDRADAAHLPKLPRPLLDALMKIGAPRRE